MKRYLLIVVLLLCIGISGKSQTLNASFQSPDQPGTVGGDAINIIPPAGYPSTWPAGSWNIYDAVKGGKVAKSRTAFFLEYGDGGFTTFESSLHTYKVVPTQPLVLTIRGKYDPIKPHGRITAYNATNLPVTPQNVQSGQQIIPSGKNITLTSDVIDLIANDTLQTVITFRKSFPGAAKILFYYNSGLQAFKSIDQYQNSKIQPCNYNPLTTLNAVRTYHQSILPDLSNTTPTLVNTGYSLNTPTANPLKAFNYINNNPPGNTASNTLVFDVTAINDNLEHNFFITLVTGDNSIYNSQLSSTSIKAFLVPDSLLLSPDPVIIRQQLFPNSASLDFPIAAPDPNSTDPDAPRPHDPNYIIADKRCTNICSTTLAGQKFNFTTHFQNDGANFAKTIVVTIYLDKKFNINSFQKISANVAGRDIVGTNFSVSFLPLSGDWYPVVCTLKTNLPTDGTVNLFGTKMASYPETDIRTMGDVKFSIYSKPQEIPSFFSIASIVFDTEAPVVTRMNRIRCCEKMGVKKDTIPDRPFGKKGKNIDRGNLRYFDNKKTDIKIKKDG